MKLTATIYWVIDALDESDNPQLLLDLMQGVSNSITPIKVILVSRFTSNIITAVDRLSSLLSVSILPLGGVKDDITLFVEQEVQHMRTTTKFKMQLVDKMVKRASGNFLWASLAMKEVTECNTEQDIDDTLNGIPYGMEDLYQRMEETAISQIKLRDQQLGHSILIWAVCSRRPLVISELLQALEPEFSLMIEINLVIGRVCGQLVIVDSATSQVMMVHQTARDYITTGRSKLRVHVAEGHEMLLAKSLAVLEEKRIVLRDLALQNGDLEPVSKGQLLNYAMTSWAYHLGQLSPDSDKSLLILAKFLKDNRVIDWVAALAMTRKLRVLVSSAKAMKLYARRKRAQYEATNPMNHHLQELNLVESWAKDLLKLVGKFGMHLMEYPAAIYRHIPPFCPKSSLIYQQLETRAPYSFGLVVNGLSRSNWDDSLAKISLQNGTQGLVIASAGEFFAVLTTGGVITLYNSVTFEKNHILRHGEEASAIEFSQSSHLLATYGYRTTKVWSVDSGSQTHQIQNPAGSSVMAMGFSVQDTQIFLSSSDQLLRVARLSESAPKWSVLHEILTDNIALDRHAHSVPWRVAFSSDKSSIAVAYRSSPMCIWSLDTARLLGRCMRINDHTGESSWAVVDQVIWHPKSDEVLGLYMGGQVFKWNPHTNTQQELDADGSVLACSPEGKFFAVGGSCGTIKLYNFQHFSMIYKLSCDQIISRICFSADSRRLYDIRGSWCNIWEPSALASGEDHEDETDLGGEAASIATTNVSESLAEVRARITAIAVDPRGGCHAAGNEIGVVSIICSSDSKTEVSELWRSSLEFPIAYLDWSSDGNLLAWVEMASKVAVKRVFRESTGTFSIQSVFQTGVDLSHGGIEQVLLNSNGTMVLIRRGASVEVQPVNLTPANGLSFTIQSPETKWRNHPTESQLLLAVSSTTLRVHRWDDLSEVTSMNFMTPTDLCSELDPDVTVDLANLDLRCQGHESIQRLCTEHSSPFLLIQTILRTNPTGKNYTSWIEFPDGLGTPCSITIPEEIQLQVKLPLGFLPKKRIVFLDQKYWICSWSLNSHSSSDQIVRHFFLPTDWRNVECLKLCALLPNGNFLIPNNGELAVIKCTSLSHG
ncbi:hypothetical protein N7488_003908 [Penicillium malachiteum]|nr:hypothetical protein N7488_003908 [Penicillium malachiteum]